jgi:hypothetical protein
VIKGVLSEDATGNSCVLNAKCVIDELLEALSACFGGDLEGLELVLGVTWVRGRYLQRIVMSYGKLIKH